MLKKTKLIEWVKEQIGARNGLPAYLRVNAEGQYVGWVSNLAIELPTDEGEMKSSLDLKQEKDLFILFALAGAWAHVGSWKNGAYFAAYLLNTNWEIDDWRDIHFCNEQISQAKKWLINVADKVNERGLFLRRDLGDANWRLALAWNDIKENLKIAGDDGNWDNFIRYLRTLKIVNCGKKAMNAKAILILRELRCQGIYPNIPGRLCCVADRRVCGFYFQFWKETLPNDKVKASERIYEDWGDLYDMPAFALAVNKRTGQRDWDIELPY